METFSEQGDAQLIGLLGELGQEDADRRHQALGQLRALPDLFWTQDRVEGALATLAPVAQAEEDDELVFLLWNLMAQLIAEHRHRQDTADLLQSLLEAQHAEVRGFAATTLGSLGVRRMASAMLQALAREPRWDVAMRLIGALHHLEPAHDPGALAPLLAAPTDEAVSYAARALMDQPALEVRPQLLAALRRVELSPSTRRTLRAVTAQADLVAARDSLPTLYMDHGTIEEADPGHHQWCLYSHRRRRLVLALHFCAAPSTHELPPELALRLELRLPGIHSSEQTRQLAQALQQAAGAQGPVRVQPEPVHDATWEAFAPLGPLNAQTALEALHHTLEPIHQAVLRMDRGARDGGDYIYAALRDLLQQLQGRASRAQRLRARFPRAQGLRTPQGAQALRLASWSCPSLRALLLQEVAPMTSQDAHEGAVVLLLPGERPADPSLDAAALAQRLARVLHWKTSLRWEALPPEQALLWAAHAGIADAEHAMAARSLALPAWPAMAPVPLRVSLSRSLETWVATLSTEASLPELLGLAPSPWTPSPLPQWPQEEPDPQEDPPTLDQSSDDKRRERLLELQQRTARHKKPQAPASQQEEPLQAEEPTTEPRPQAPPMAPRPPAPPEKKPQRAPALPSARKGKDDKPNKAPALPSARQAKPQRAPALPGKKATAQPDKAVEAAASGPDDASTGPLDAQGRTPSQVVKALSANVETVDVYLRSAGYNHTKLSQIMSILLGFTPAQARERIENAPGVLMENIPRDRARTIRTVLEGTGAKIAITSPGDAPPAED